MSTLEVEMWRLAILTGSIGVILSLGMPWASAKTHRKAVTKCPAGRSHVVIADAQAQVYKGPSVGEGGLLPEFPVFHGCVYGHRKSYELGLLEVTGAGSPGGTSGSRLYTLAGPIVAFEENSVTELEPASRYEGEIVVRNLRSGWILHRLPTGTPTVPPRNRGDVGIGRATAIVVKNNGSVAWIVETGYPDAEYQLHAVDKSGNRVLASAPGIVPSSLALASNTLYWMQGDKPMSAVLN